MSHILSWVFKVSGLHASEGFAFMGNSPAGVDYYDVREPSRLCTLRKPSPALMQWLRPGRHDSLHQRRDDLYQRRRDHPETFRGGEFDPDLR